MMWTLGAVGFVLALMVTIAIHEFGHLLAAKTFKLEVPQYFIGFGKTLFSRKRGDTEYGIKAIPLGGYVLIKDPKVDDPESDEAMLLSNVKPWKRQIVFAAGPAVNIVLGTLMFFVIMMSISFPAPTSVIEATTCEQNQICAAEEAGILAGDKVLKVNGDDVGEGGIPVALLDKHMNDASSVVFTVERDGAQKDIEVSPVRDDGRWMIGIQMDTVERNLSLGEASTAVTNIYKQNFQAILNIPAQVPVLIDIIKGGERPDTAPVSVVGATKVSGDTTASTILTNEDKWYSFLMLVASFNVGIGLINLLPILPLDGGRMLVAFLDTIKIRLARLRQIEYKPVSAKVVTVSTLVLGVLIFSYMGLVILADIVNPVNIN